ncbi:putative signal transducing protein [Bacilliculturomica massiliensis]|uniref:putative signal transducing protein n=1 Tax=Bacilliculturomica massiliensis TaxID=1917867 RepID=UPI001031D910|nr:DUF2007 domain-containing protein [Bacilliculturomica massiliensis]
MFGRKDGKEKELWRDGVYLTTVENTLQADILESKLRSEGIPAERRYEGSGNYMEIFMGKNVAFPIELYVPEDCLEDAKNIIVPVPLTEEEFDQAQEDGSRSVEEDDGAGAGPGQEEG